MISTTNAVSIYGIESTNKIFSLSACAILKFKIACIALCDPHPGHLYPVISLNEHLGK